MRKKINSLFWAFWVPALCLYLVEAVFYSGFILKHLGFTPLVLAAATGILGALILILKFITKDIKPRKSERIILIFFIFLLSLYVVLKIANRLTYANFVFSKLHVQPNNLFWPVLISFIPAAILWIPRIDFKKLLKIKFVLTLFVFSIIIANFYKIYKTEQWAFQFIITNPRASYGDKMRRAVGQVFYDYTQFINKYTPENSVVLMPPQAFPWPQSGNGAFLRYFVYPRKVGNGGEYTPGEKVKLENFNYVLLAWGETETTEGAYTHGWPKFDVPAEKIIFMNEDGTIGGEVAGNYRYKDYKDKRVWGLIKVKR